MRARDSTVKALADFCYNTVAWARVMTLVPVAGGGGVLFDLQWAEEPKTRVLIVPMAELA